jgi:glyoxylase-like metal-dependent hydrolase (beta-lactamase superfamily II)
MKILADICRPIPGLWARTSRFLRRRLRRFRQRFFHDEHAVHVNGATLTLRHYGAAHTDSDISVYFTDADILHTGETFWIGAYPFIDYSTGDSIDGLIRAAEENLATSIGKTVVIPEHGRSAEKLSLRHFAMCWLKCAPRSRRSRNTGDLYRRLSPLDPVPDTTPSGARLSSIPRGSSDWCIRGMKITASIGLRPMP